MKTGPKAGEPVASRFAKIEGKRLHYLTAGEGPISAKIRIDRDWSLR
jgi:hypothetical protein